jgi:hypothetical protein
MLQASMSAASEKNEVQQGGISGTFLKGECRETLDTAAHW